MGSLIFFGLQLSISAIFAAIANIQPSKIFIIKSNYPGKVHNLPKFQLLLALVAGVLYDSAQRTLVAPVAVAPTVPAGAALTVCSPG